MVGKSFVAGLAPVVHRRKVARRKRTALTRQLVDITLQPENDAVLVQKVIVFLPRHTAAARGNDRAGALAEFGNGLALELSEFRLAVLFDELGTAHTVFLFDLGVAVKRDAVKLLSKARGNGALAAAGHADEHDVLHLKAQLFPDALGLAVGDVAVFKDLRRALSLRDEHVEPAHIRNVELFRLQDKRCTRGVVDDIEHTLELREERQVDGRHAAVRVHADGRGVHDDLRVRVTIQIVVVVLPLAGDDGHAARAHLLEHGTDRRGGAAGAEHERLFAIDLNAARPDHTGKAVGIGVVAVQRAVLAPDQHVHTLEFLRNG